jgi:hypothetical protein
MGWGMKPNKDVERTHLEWVDHSGRTWRTYTCSYDTADGKFCFTIMALSMEHAAAMLEELKETARLDGEVGAIIEWSQK